MDSFLHGPELARAIRDILSETNTRAAVAFWGDGCQDWVTGAGGRVLANLMMGGTNPYALEKINAEVRQSLTLHAKVYIGAEQTIVCSANASINGLALEGAAQTGWIEAGLLTPTTDDIVSWFEALWTEPSSSISFAQWKEAKRLWDLRRTSFKPSLGSFQNFDVEATELPPVTWVNSGEEWTINEAAIEASGVIGFEVERRVDDGLWIRDESDVSILSNRWVLIFQKLKSGRPGRKAWFVQMSDVFVPGGFMWSDGEPQDVLLSAERAYPPPFDPRERRFVDAMQAVLADPAFALLLDNENEQKPWYLPRQAVTREFWRAVRMAFDAPGATAKKLN